LLAQLVIYAASEDLTRIKQTTDEVETLTRRWPGWLPVRQYGLGEYHRIRGDHAAALREFEQFLAEVPIGTHQIWANAAGAHVRTLFELERHDQALERARAYLAAAEQAEQGHLCNFIRMPLALVQAKLGDVTDATAHADAVIENLRALGSKGLLLALAYETRARVAVIFQDNAAFGQYAALCADQLRAGSSRVLTAKLEKLKQVALRAEMSLQPETFEGAMMTEISGSQLTSMLDGCRGFSERAQQALNVVLRHSGAGEGFLFTVGENGPELAARIGDCERPERVAVFAREYLEAELRDQEMHTSTISPESAPLISELTGSQGERYLPVLLGHPVQSGFAITGVIVAVIKPGKRFAFAGPVATQLSRLLHESGDVAPAIIST
jgi:hypothetical protein